MRPSTLRAAVLCGGLALAGIGAPAASAATAAGFANVVGSEPIGSFTNLQTNRAFNTARVGAPATLPQAIVFHARTGRYSVRFPGLAVTNQPFVSGGVTVRATGAANAVCQPAGKPHGTVNNQLEQDVSCFDAFGGVRDSSFDLSFVHGPADAQDLIVARSENVLGAAFAPLAVQETTLAGVAKPGSNVFGRRTALGQYALELPRTTGPVSSVGSNMFWATWMFSPLARRRITSKPVSSRSSAFWSRSAVVGPPMTTAIRRRLSRTAETVRLKPEALVKPVFRPSTPSMR